MRKLTTVIVLATVLIAGGLGCFALASNDSHVPMTGQKLVSLGGCMLDGHTLVETVVTFTNPDCVGEITIERISIIAESGTVIYEGQLLDREGSPLPQTLGPHEVGTIVLRLYISRYYGFPPGDFKEFPVQQYTVEVFWTGSDNTGLPLIGWAVTQLLEVDEDGNRVGRAGGWTIQMVNMEQKLAPKKPE